MKAPVMLVVLATAGLAAPAQEPRPTFPAETELVTVDAVVLDRDGIPVRGLAAEDFSLSQDGDPQSIVAFEAVEVQAPSPGPAVGEEAPLPHVSSNRHAPTAPTRVFVVVFDDLHLNGPQAASGREAVAAFLQSAADGDRVILMASGETSWWHGRMPEGREGLLAVLGRLKGRARTGELSRERMTDQEAVHIYRDDDPLVFAHVVRRFSAEATDWARGADPAIIIERVKSTAARVYQDGERRRRETLDCLVRALVSIAEVRGRKSVLLVSGGLIHDPHPARYRAVVAEARRANAAVYFVDARGLLALGPDFTAEARSSTEPEDMHLALGHIASESEGSESLAADTGGFSVKNRNDLGEGMRAISAESSSYYLLGYVPPTGGGEGFRRIDVKVARPGVRVRARRGYYPRTSADAREAGEEAWRRTLDSPFDLDALPLRAAAHVFGEKTPGQARVLITTEVDTLALELREEAGFGVDTLECRLTLTNRDTGAVHRGEQRVAVRQPLEKGGHPLRTWLPLTSEAALGPGRYGARVVVADTNGGRAGSVSHELEVPPLSGLRISTPVLSDKLREPSGTGPELIARRTFAPAGVLHCHFEVYGATTDPVTNRSAVSAGLTVRHADGTVLAAADPTPVEPRPDGTLARTLGVPLEGVREGSYELVVLAVDEVSGGAVEASEPFVVDPSAGT
jgi:VWFA-related protein